jgi:hypothetical protein
MKRLYRFFPRFAFGFSLGGCCLVLVSCTPNRHQTVAERLKWEGSLTNNYQSGASRDPKWDKAAEEALTDFAEARAGSVDDWETRFDLVGSLAKTAVEAGCNDPMLRFLYYEYGSGNSSKSLPERQDEFRSVAHDLESSPYSPIWKFYANLNAAGMLWQRYDKKLWPEVRQFRGDAVADLSMALRDQTLPEVEAYEACDSLFHVLKDDTYELTNAYSRLEGPLFQHHPRWGTAYLIRADYYLVYAWIGRGHGYADKVTPEAWRLFRERLAESDSALKKAWSLDPHDEQIPTLMISVVEGEQKGRPEMELWFQRAMQLDPDNYPACRSKLHFLYPEWYGSRDEMVSFGRECVASTNWGGHVPLILVDAHSEFIRFLPKGEQRNDYWKLPDVWPDIKSAYEKYFELNPAATRFRYPYAAYAFRCGQWQGFDEQIKIIRQNDFDINYNYFGGRDVFDKMVALAQQQGAQKPAY